MVADARDGGSGSIAIRVRPVAGIWSKVSISGSPIFRSGAIAVSPSSWLPMQVAAICSNFLPRIASGTSGRGGRFIIRTMLATSSGTRAAQSR